MTDETTIEEARQRAHYALHKLWTRAVGTKGYVKHDWLELEAAIYALVRLLRQRS